MITKAVTIYVTLESDKSEPGGMKFMHLKVGNNPPCQLPKDVPAPRRLVRELIDAVVNAASEAPTKEAPKKAPPKKGTEG